MLCLVAEPPASSSFSKKAKSSLNRPGSRSANCSHVPHAVVFSLCPETVLDALRASRCRRALPILRIVSTCGREHPERLTPLQRRTVLAPGRHTGRGGRGAPAARLLETGHVHAGSSGDSRGAGDRIPVALDARSTQELAHRLNCLSVRLGIVRLGVQNHHLAGVRPCG